MMFRPEYFKVTNPGTSGRDRLLRILPYALLFILSGALYLKSIWFEFIPTWDDAEYVMNNPLIQGLGLDSLKGIFTTQIMGNYAPFNILSYVVDYAFWGLDPRGYHLSNVILHACNAAAAYAALAMITRRKDAAFIAALLFAVHPVNVENVAWISERKSLLAALFFFLSLISYLKFRDNDREAYYFSALGLFVCGILSKVSIVILPVILGVHELLIRRHDRKFRTLLPFLVISLFGAAVEIWAHIENRSIEGGFTSPEFLFGTVYPTMVPVFWKYVGLLIWPFNLSGYYDTPLYRSFLTDLPVVLSLGAWTAVFAVVFLRTGAQVRFWFAWFWICLLPVSNIIPILVFYADRYMYIPAIGMFVLAGLGISRLAGGQDKETGDRRDMSAMPRELKTKALLWYAAAGLICLICASASWQRTEVWRNEVVFWEDTAKKSPGLYKARLNLGVAYEKTGRLEDAEREYYAAVQIFQGGDATANLETVRKKIRLNKELNIYR